MLVNKNAVKHNNQQSHFNPKLWTWTMGAREKRQHTPMLIHLLDLSSPGVMAPPAETLPANHTHLAELFTTWTFHPWERYYVSEQSPDVQFLTYW